MKKKKVMFICSVGGHLTQMLQMKKIFNEYDYVLITEKTDVTKKMKDKYNIEYLVYGSRNYLFSYIFKFSFNIIKSLILFIKYRPKTIITTGTHTAVPMCYIGKLFRRKIIYIESFAKRTSPTLSGKMVYPIADIFIVQWESMLSIYPKAKYFGPIVQAGYTEFNSKKMKIIDFINYAEMEKLVDKADLIITHGGTGSILGPLKKNKKVIACARLAKYGEHVDNHQEELVSIFAKEGYILELGEDDNLDDLLSKIDKFKPKKYVSNTDNFIDNLKKLI